MTWPFFNDPTSEVPPPSSSVVAEQLRHVRDNWLHARKMDLQDALVSGTHEVVEHHQDGYVIFVSMPEIDVVCEYEERELTGLMITEACLRPPDKIKEFLDAAVAKRKETRAKGIRYGSYP